MITECARCPTSVCRLGRPEESPEDCPMRQDFPDHRVLYAAEEVRRRTTEAALIEAYGYCRWTRLDEVGEFARRMECVSVGFGYCAGMEREARLAASYLRNLGLHVELPAGGRCDPEGQAEHFNAACTDINVIAGMCVGHDAHFLKASQAGVTCLVARDTFLQHNPVGAIYASRTYFHHALYQVHLRPEKVEWEGAIAPHLHHIASEVAHEGQGRWTRLEETIELAHRLGATRLGLAFCHGLREEAKVVDNVLQANGFEVRSVGCKVGAVPKEEFGILDAQKVRPGQPEPICNPLAQAELLNKQQTHLNLVMGQCVGHDMATMRSLEAPTTCLIAKDRVLAHNTVAALYAWQGQLEKAPA